MYKKCKPIFSVDNTKRIKNLKHSKCTCRYNNFFGIDSVPSMDNKWRKLGQDIDGEAIGDFSGWSVSMNSPGNRVAISAPYNDGNVNNSGSVRVYEWNTTSSIWIQIGQDIDGEDPFDSSGYSVSMNSLGNRVAIGSSFNDGNGNDSGSVRIYEFDGSMWIKIGQDIDGEATNNYSGWSVSMNSSGNRVAIGAPNNNNNGYVRIYEFNGSIWVKLGLNIVGEAINDGFGHSVSINSLGNRVAISAPYNDDNGSNSGSVYVYEFNGSNWEQLGQDINGEAALDQSGWSVSMNSLGSRVAIGAVDNSSIGHVRVYEFNSASSKWVKLGQDIDGEAINDTSGYSVSMNSSGNRVAIGAPSNDGNGTNSGSVRVYELVGSKWVQVGIDIDGEAALDQSGASVSMNSLGNRVAIGSPSNGGNGNNSGSVRVYEYGEINVKPQSRCKIYKN